MMQAYRCFRLLGLCGLLLGALTLSVPALANATLVNPVTGSDSSSSAASSQPSRSCEGDDCQSHSSDNPLNLDVGRVVETDKLAESWEARINTWFERYKLDESPARLALASLVIVAVALSLMALVRLAVNRLFERLRRVGRYVRISRRRIKLYRRLVSFVFSVVIVCLAGIALMVAWDGTARNLAFISQFRSLLGTVFNATVVLVAVVVIYELVSAALERYFQKLANKNSPRVNTLLPITRNVIYATLVIIFGMTVVSELGVDVTPLLASAGVLGVAIGFGAQALIRDVLNGFIVIVEDLIQVGDVATLGGKTGIIEKITLRKVQLRDLDGRVYTVPFSAITVVENYTKEFSYYMFNVGVAYRESPDEVIAVMRELSAEMEADEYYGEKILEPIEILGVDQFADSAIIIKARIKTRPIMQWEVGREFNRRMKYAFDERGIEIPFLHRTLYFGEDKEGKAPAARVLMEQLESRQAANDGQSSER